MKMATTPTVTADPAQVEQIRKLIEEHLKAQATAGLPDAMSVDAKGVFCANWDMAKLVLGALSGLLTAIPGVGIFAGPAVGVITAAGDAAAKTICGK
jgi:hypothetical protein